MEEIKAEERWLVPCVAPCVCGDGGVGLGTVGGWGRIELTRRSRVQMVNKSPETSTSPDASTVLAQIRERHNEMLVRERERKRRIAAACKPFARARAAMASAEANYTKTAEDLERRRAAAETRREEKVAQRRREMAAAVQAIRGEDMSAAEVATLLGLSQAEVRDLGQLHNGTPDTASAGPPKRSNIGTPVRSTTESGAPGGTVDNPEAQGRDSGSPAASRLGLSDGDPAAAAGRAPVVDAPTRPV